MSAKKIKTYLRTEPKDDPEWVRVVHAIRASMGDKKTTDEDVKKIMDSRGLKANFICV